MPSLSYEVDNGPVILSFLQTLDGKMRQFRAAESTTETNREAGSASLAPHRLDVCGVQQCSCFIGAEPIAKSYPEFLCSLYAADAGCQFRAKQAGISGLICKSPDSGQSQIDRRRSQVTGLDRKSDA